MLIPQKMCDVCSDMCVNECDGREETVRKEKMGHERTHARTHAHMQCRKTDMQLTFLNGVSKLYVTTTLTTTRR